MTTRATITLITALTRKAPISAPSSGTSTVGPCVGKKVGLVGAVGSRVGEKLGLVGEKLGLVGTKLGLVGVAVGDVGAVGESVI